MGIVFAQQDLKNNISAYKIFILQFYVGQLYFFVMSFSLPFNIFSALKNTIHLLYKIHTLSKYMMEMVKLLRFPLSLLHSIFRQ